MDIAIRQYKNREIWERTLTSLSKVELPENANTIWLVEHGGVYGAENVVSRFEELLPVKYLYLNQGNLLKVRNFALEKTEADIILFLTMIILSTREALSNTLMQFKRIAAVISAFSECLYRRFTKKS